MTRAAARAYVRGAMDADAFRAAGLWDPYAPDAADRLRVLSWLVERGMTVDEIVRELRTRPLPALTADVGLRPWKRLTLAGLAVRTGLPAERIAAISLAAGVLPAAADVPAFSEDDVPTFLAFAGGAGLFGDVAVRRFTRVMGSALAAIADAAISLFLVTLERPIVERGGNETALAVANLEAMERLELVPTALRGLFRAHLEQAIRRSRAARDPLDVESARLTVGFVDLVGFTALSRRVATRDLNEVIDRFEDAAHEIATLRGGRIVKLVGDEVMFVTLGAAAGCDIALTLVEQFAGDATIRPRGGLATGDLLVRAGDYYGPVVNLAARLAELAVPGELLVNAEVADEARDGALAFRAAGKRLPKGFDAPVEVLSVERG